MALPPKRLIPGSEHVGSTMLDGLRVKLWHFACISLVLQERWMQKKSLYKGMVLICVLDSDTIYRPPLGQSMCSDQAPQLPFSFLHFSSFVVDSGERQLRDQPDR